MGSTVPRTAMDSVPAALDTTPVRCRPVVPVHHRVPDDRILYRAVNRWDDSLYPEYNTKAARLATYSSWPRFAAQSPEALSDCGFFYKGNTSKLVFHRHTHTRIYLSIFAISFRGFLQVIRMRCSASTAEAGSRTGSPAISRFSNTPSTSHTVFTCVTSKGKSIFASVLSRKQREYAHEQSMTESCNRLFQ